MFIKFPQTKSDWSTLSTNKISVQLHKINTPSKIVEKNSWKLKTDRHLIFDKNLNLFSKKDENLLKKNLDKRQKKSK
jgi:hypothetical protein